MIPTAEGRLYLATVIDIASRRVVGWATGQHLRTDLVADALKAPCRPAHHTSTIEVSRRPVESAQYTSQQFAALASEFDVLLKKRPS